MELRDIQVRPVDVGVEILTSRIGRRELLCLPGAFGKSFVIACIVDRLPLEGNLLVVHPNVTLLTQNLEKLGVVGREAAVYCGDLKRKEYGRIIYASVGSINDKLMVEGKIRYVIIDEAEYATKSGTKFAKLMDKHGVRNILGLTATPVYTETNGYGAFMRVMTKVKSCLFTDIAHVVQNKEMEDLGYWTPLKFMECRKINRSALQLNSSGNDFDDQVLLNRFLDEELWGEVVNCIGKVPDNKPTLVFIPAVDKFEEQINSLPGATFISSKVPAKEKARRVSDFKKGLYSVLFNTEIATAGFDHPDLYAIVDALPTNSYRSNTQKMLRGVRKGNKDVCLVFDIADNTSKFGDKLSDITYEYIKGYGWGVFNKDILISDVPLSSKRVYTKSDIVNNKGRLPQALTYQDKQAIITFGQFKGEKVGDVMYKNASLLKWMRNRMQEDGRTNEELFIVLDKLFY